MRPVFVALVYLVLLTSCSKVPPEATAAPESAAAQSPSIPLAIVPPGKSIGLPKLADHPQAVMERIGDVWSPGVKQPVPLPADVPITFLGWAVDEPKKTVAGGVDVLFDGMPYAAEYGIERGDVASYTKVPAYQNSGFRLTLPAYKIDKGRHQVMLRVLTKDGKAFYETDPIEVEVR